MSMLEASSPWGQIHFPGGFGRGAQEPLSQLRETVGFIGDKGLNRASAALMIQEAQMLQSLANIKRAAVCRIHQGNFRSGDCPNRSFEQRIMGAAENQSIDAVAQQGGEILAQHGLGETVL